MTRQGLKKVSVEVTIINKLGLHARAAALLREYAQRFKSDIFVKKNDVEVNAKSLLGLIAMGASRGAVIRITATGPDADEAVETLKNLVENKFNEKE